MKKFDSLYRQLLADIHCLENVRLFGHLTEIVVPRSHEVIDYCCEMLLDNSDLAGAVDKVVANKYLKTMMVDWLNKTFVYCATIEERDAYFQYQIAEGHVYACIDLPVSLVNYAMHLIKIRVFNLLKGSDLSRDELSEALILANQILDWVNVLLIEICQHDLLVNEKSSQSLKLHVSAQNLAFDCERLRSSLSEWMRGLLLAVQQNRYDPCAYPTIRHSNFGLWISHKGPLFLADRVELTVLDGLLNDIDDGVRQLNASLHEGPVLAGILKRLNEHVSHAVWVLGNIANEMLNEEKGRDPLTRLYNRRYLDTIMRYEATYNLKNGTRFGLLMIDIDFFKQINDRYGHDNGDRVLAQLAEILTQQVRAGDFVFRLGGEEFLVILSDVDQAVTKKIGEKIREFIEQYEFQIHDQCVLTLTVSIGVAIYDGHPDYNRTIKLSDAALYQAKENGRNRLVVAKQEVDAYA